ncbi:hypothetical protein [Lentzea californiensis]|uniref:hypothetical protein n=1 Tax=Lentzea californiensis TaxID=438851 RepID=UPI002164058F|nr:hypothetical protein [Lentzea californiensis]MCR3747131.1 hypothetical protein [Lentzea californiensis]
MTATEQTVIEQSSEPTVRLAPVPAAAPGITFVRAAAAVLVLHGFLVGLWATQHGLQLGYLDAVRFVLNRTLGIGEDFGVFAVMLLLTAGGYLAQLQRGRLMRRLISGYLPAGVTTLLAAGLVTLGAGIWNWPTASHTSPLAVIGNLSLGSQLVTGKPLLVPLAWFVLLLLTGTLAAAATNRFGVAVPIVQIAAVCATVVVAPDSRAASVLVFFSLVVAGQLIALHQRGDVKTWVATTVGALGAAPLLLLGAMNEEIAKWWYPVSALYAVLLTTVAVVFSGETAAKAAAHPVVRWLSDHAIWLALLQGVAGYPVLALLHGLVPLGVAFPAAIVATAVAAALSHRLTDGLRA